MPRLRLLLNIGSRDCPRLGLDPPNALAGDTVDVADAAADEMLRRGWATDKLDAPGAAATDARLTPEERRRAAAATDAGREADRAAAEAAQPPAAGTNAPASIPAAAAPQTGNEAQKGTRR